MKNIDELMAKFNQSKAGQTGFVQSGMATDMGMGLLSAMTTQSLGHMQNPNGSVPNFNPMDYFAMGGIGNGRMAEVEGGEVIDHGGGGVEELKGPTHAQGGMDRMIEKDDVVFSKKIKRNGVSMADRKITRTKKLDKLMKMMDSKNREPMKNIDQETDARMKYSLDMEEKEDREYQAMAAQLKAMDDKNYGKDRVDTSGDKPKLAYGYIPGVNPPRQKNFFLTPNGQLPDYTRPYIQPPAAIQSKISPASLPSQPLGVTAKTASPSTTPTNNSFYDPTKGQGLDTEQYNSMGHAGTIFNSIAPLANSMFNASQDKANINPNLSVNKDAINTNLRMQDNLQFERDLSDQDLGRQRNSAVAGAGNNSRGINQLRSMQAVSQVAMQGGKAKNKAAYMKQLSEAMKVQSQLEGERSKYIAVGEKDRDENDRKDRDNRNTQMAENLSNLGFGMQNLAAQKNEAAKQAKIGEAFEQYKKGAITENELMNFMRSISISMGIPMNAPKTKTEPK